MRFLAAIFASIFVPALALGVTIWPHYQDSGGDVIAALSATQACATAAIGQGGVCAAPPVFGWVSAAAVITAAAGVGLIVLFRLVAVLLGGSRAALGLVFPPLAFVGVALAGLIAVSQLSLVAGGAYLSQRLFFNEPNYLLAAAIGAVALATGFAAMRDTLGLFQPAQTGIIGLRVDKYEQPRLALFIKSIADRIDARTPDNIVIGLDASFFVTSARVHTPFQKDPLKGETLYISAPLLRALTKTELASILGHELAHFSGGDTAYSRRFAPIYLGMTSAAQSLRGEGRLPRPWTAPARAIVMDMIGAFTRAERRIGRGREIRADEIGAKAGSPQALATSLLKMSILGAVWRSEVDGMMARIEKGRYARNLSRNFVERLRYDLDHERVGPWIELAMLEEAPHPTDTHPPTADRISAIGLDPSTVVDAETLGHKFVVEDPVAHSVLNDLESLEEALTHAFHRIAMDTGAATAPDERDFHEFFLAMLNDFLAMMVTIDGSVDHREIETAEEEARKWVDDFDAVGFRERCRHPKELAELDKLIEVGNDVLKPSGAKLVLETLEKIAGADGEIHPQERALLDRLKAELKGSDGDAPASDASSAEATA